MNKKKTTTRKQKIQHLVETWRVTGEKMRRFIYYKGLKVKDYVLYPGVCFPRSRRFA